MDVENYWNSKRDELLSSIDQALERGVDEDTKATLELMKELTKGAKVRKSIAEYFNEVDE